MRDSRSFIDIVQGCRKCCRRYWFQFLSRTKRYGLYRTALWVLGTLIYALVCPFYKLYILRFTSVSENQFWFKVSPSGQDNCEALMNYILAAEKNAEIIVQTDSLKSQRTFLGKYIDNKRVTVITNQFRQFSIHKSLLTCKYVFYSDNSPFKRMYKRTGQFVVNLWHGCGYKDATDKWITGTMFDYVLVPGKTFIDTKSKFFSCDREQILPVGYPRYDLLMKEYPLLKQQIKKNLFRKIIIWMPTFRRRFHDENTEYCTKPNFDIPLLNSVDDLIEINNICASRKIFLYIKRHPAQIPYTCERMAFSNIVFINNETLSAQGIQTYELLSITDALISDYSSVAIDYLLLDKPIAFALDDFEQYKSTRGFVFDDPLEYMPGHHLYTFEDLKAFIRDVAEDHDPYAEQRHQIMPEVHNPCGNYCERIWSTVKRLAEE